MSLARKLVLQMTNKNPILRIQTAQILTSNFMMKYYYDDSIKEVSEAKKSRMSVSQSQKKMVDSVQQKLMDSQGQQGQAEPMTKLSKKNQILSLEEVDKQKQMEKLIDKTLNFKDSASSNSLKHSMPMDNTLKPPGNPTSRKSISSHEPREGVEGFRSVK